MWINGAWENMYVFEFWKTDGKWNEDDKSVSVKVNARDQYTRVLAREDDKFDLTKILPAITPVRFDKRALLQFYSPGDSYITCISSSNNWEEEVDIVEYNTTTLKNSYHFLLYKTFLTITVTGSGYPPDATGTYIETVYSLFQGKNGTHRIETEYTGGQYYYNIILDEGSVVLFRAGPYSAPLSSGTLDFVAVNGEGTLTGNYSNKVIYARWLHNVDTIGDVLLLHDMANGRGYTYAIGDDSGLGIVCHTYTQDEVTQYGLATDGEYFIEPEVVSDEHYLPVNQSTWLLYSLWFNFTEFDTTKEALYRKQYQINHSVMLSDVIQALLVQISSNITHLGTYPYSDFLYATNPITGEDFRLAIARKKPVLQHNFTLYNEESLISFSDVMNMLRICYKCYWFIDSSMRLRIEHISWFRNGGSYSAPTVFNADLTTMLYRRNNKTWGYNTSLYQYEKISLPEKIEFSWQDEVTGAFDGYPIEVLSRFIQQGKKDSYSVSEFTSDIDFVLMDKSELSDTGFVILAVENSLGYWKTIYQTYIYYSMTMNLQNGVMSFLYLHEKFWVYDLPSLNVKINNGTTITALGVEKNKKQTVNYPSDSDPDPLLLIKTSLGYGQIEKININLSSRMNEISLKYDTE